MSEYFGNLKKYDLVRGHLSISPWTPQVNLDWVRGHLPVTPKHSLVQKKEFRGLRDHEQLRRWPSLRASVHVVVSLEAEAIAGPFLARALGEAMVQPRPRLPQAALLEDGRL
jgi:hypothetical protein